MTTLQKEEVRYFYEDEVRTAKTILQNLFVKVSISYESYDMYDACVKTAMCLSLFYFTICMFLISTRQLVY